MLENSKPRSYSCLMLDCQNFKNYLKEIQNKINENDLYIEEDGYGFETEPHITVLYGIHESDSSVVKNLIKFKPLTYTLTKLSLFENEKYDVLKCSVKSSDLKKLNKECCKNLKFTSNFPDYIPHLTVCYLKPGMGSKYIKLKSESFEDKLTSGKFLFSDKDSKKSHWIVE